MVTLVNLSVSSNAGTEAGTTIITVIATAASAVSGDQTLNLGVSGTGITTSDYYLSNTTITIPNGQSSGSVNFIVADDAIAEGTETATLTISNPSAGLTLGTTTTQNITITNNDNSFLTKVGGATSVNGAEIPAFDSGSKRLFVVAGNTIEFYTVSTTGTLTLAGSLTPTITPPAGAVLIPNSVAVKNGVVAVAYAVAVPVTGTEFFIQQTGKVAFFNAANGNFINAVDVGALPDMLTFTPDGTKVLVANEGEPNSYNRVDSVDPEGSISIINIANGVASATVQTADFTSFNSQMATLKAAGVRIIGPGSTVAQDLEPEYIAVSPDGLTATITLQENNAIAILDIASATITQILPLGAKNYNLPGNGIDASDQDSAINGGINIQNWPVFGLYQPDAIASFSINGQAYYITANEGDSRNYPGFNEEIRVGAAGYVLDPTAFPNAATLKQNANLGRLQLTNATGDTDGDGDIDRIESFGARSFSIWNANGTQVFDSGDQLEQITAAKTPTLFNSDGTAATFNTRSDNKGPEPEGVVVGVINGRTYAFIGIERSGDVFVYDVTNPNQPTFVQYINIPEDTATEGLTFISAADSPTGKPLLVTASEVSKTVAIFEVKAPPSVLFNIDSASANEGNGITFKITRTGDDQFSQTVTVSTSIKPDDTASQNDFTPKNETLTFALGETTKTFTVQTNQDSLVEKDETFTVALTNPTNGAIINEGTAKGTISNDDIPLAKVNTNDVFTIKGESNQIRLKISLLERNSRLINELCVFKVDDAQGNINGIAPGTTDYNKEVLKRANVVLSVISNLPNGLNIADFTRLLEFNSGDNLKFLLIKDGTIDSAKAGQTPLSNLLFADAKITNLETEGFSLAWKDGSGNLSDFKDLVVKLQSTKESLVIGTALQGGNQGEIIDLKTSLDGVKQVKADFSAYREASYNNEVYFYKIDNADGQIGSLQANSANRPNYLQAALNNLLKDAKTGANIKFAADNQGVQTGTANIATGVILAPMIVVNGTLSQLLDSDPNNNPQVYFPYLGVNSDGIDHIRLLGNNTFGFEDLANGGDFDYNDIIVKMNFTPVLA